MFLLSIPKPNLTNSVYNTNSYTRYTLTYIQKKNELNKKKKKNGQNKNKAPLE